MWALSSPPAVEVYLMFLKVGAAWANLPTMASTSFEVQVYLSTGAPSSALSEFDSIQASTFKGGQPSVFLSVNSR